MKTYMNLDKSPRRLAMEIRGKDKEAAECHLIKYGAFISDAEKIISRCVNSDRRVIGDINFIESCIKTNYILKED